MNIVDVQLWKKELPEFKEKTALFYTGEMSKAEYKGFSGKFGSYAQKGGKASMLRLRMPAGCVTKEKLAFVADVIRKYNLKKVHFTTCQTIQLHDLQQDVLCNIMEEALDEGIIIMGGGGDFPRNVMCSPLSGVERDEYFDVRPWAKAAGEYLLNFINAAKMPRKLKVGFSNSPKNLTHATYRDLGFVATPEGKFDVYSAGGLGNNARFGVKVAEGIEPEKILYYIKAMWLTFRTYGNYQNRGKARTRYMQDVLGGPEQYAEAYQLKLKEVLNSGENLNVSVETEEVKKTEDGTRVSGKRILPQKQNGLYTVVWHPIGGRPETESICALSDVIRDMTEVELRLAPDETAYIINLTGEEVEKVLKATPDSAQSEFEMSVSCIGAGICQVGLRDSQGLLQACVDAVREAEIPDSALPRIHISGCPSSCGTHQTGVIGFRGAVKNIDGKVSPAFVLYVNGEERQGKERMGRELGMVPEEKIPEFLVKLGRTVAESKQDFASWNEDNPDGLERAAKEYLIS